MYDYYDIYDALAPITNVTSSGTYRVLNLALTVLVCIALWKVFVKAGEEGWAAIVPFYNLYVLFKITWGNGWLFLLILLVFIPILGWIALIVIMIITMVKLAKSFGKGGGFACGLIFLYQVFLPIMAFSKDIQYIGPDGVAPEAPGEGYGGAYTRQEPEFRQYQQGSDANEQYRYQRNEPQGAEGGFCPQCGAKVEPGTKFCPVCGKQLTV